MALNTNGTLMFERLLTDASYLYIESDFVCSASNDWIHVVYICQPNKLKIYVNGSLDKEETDVLAYASTSVANDEIVGFGLRWRSNAVISPHDDSHGYIDDFRIYDKALSATEISNLYNNNIIIENPEYKTLTFTHDGSTDNQTEYTVNFPENTTCDILIVGGGGAGGNNHGGGGGGGAVIYCQNKEIPSGNYTIKVGNGGNTNQENGKATDAFNVIADGGGGGGKYNGITAKDGGCGGGSPYNSSSSGNSTITDNSSTCLLYTSPSPRD